MTDSEDMSPLDLMLKELNINGDNNLKADEIINYAAAMDKCGDAVKALSDASKKLIDLGVLNVEDLKQYEFMHDSIQPNSLNAVVNACVNGELNKGQGR